jgi:hypothetical protein
MNFIINILFKLKKIFYLQKVKFLSKNVLYDFNSNWFKNKRVAIVGGADSVLKEKLGNYIDEFDVVIRINKGVEIISNQSEYVGKKTDFLFHSFYEITPELGGSPITPELWYENKVKRIIFARNFNYCWFSLKNVLTYLNKTYKHHRSKYYSHYLPNILCWFDL